MARKSALRAGKKTARKKAAAVSNAPRLKRAVQPVDAVAKAGKAPDAGPEKTPAARFPVVGIGASAGGLEAYEQFFRSVQADIGLAFVLVSHLDPDHDSLLTEILQRSTKMPVVEAQDQVKVAPNHVYVIPPNRDMTIFHGALQLSVPQQPRGQRMPIDAFLRSLAEDQGEQAVGIVLSGTGTDGTLGLRAILGEGGVSLVQEPASAKYDGMPTSAIKCGYATHTLAPEKMPEALQAVVRRLGVHEQAPAVLKDSTGVNRILMALRSGTGHDFSLYKKSTIGRRIERRLALHNIQDMAVYARYLAGHPDEMRALFRELLINVTCFFRDPEAFVVLKQDILPLLLKDKPEDYVFRVWVAGCSSGEEAYSIAMLLREYLDQTGQSIKIQMYATDLDDDAIAIARAGVYPPNIAQDVTPERLRRFFSKEEAGYRVKKDIREMVVFAVQNVIKDPPFTKLDLVCCRNLMIYLELELQNRLVLAFHFALKPGGVLCLSPSEGIAGHTELFTAINRKLKFYRANASATPTRALMTSGLSWATYDKQSAPEEAQKKAAATNFTELTRRALLQAYAPASVVTDLKGNILYVHGDTGKYLRPAPGQATLNVVDMAREGLQQELRTAIHNAGNKHAPPFRSEVPVKTDGGSQTINLSARALPDTNTFTNSTERLLLFSFEDLPQNLSRARSGKRARGKHHPGAPERRRIEELERDLANSRASVQATIEEQQASNEELKSTNEEMQSTNEELQSTNEELETSKEELQSVNEELVTVNAELQAKIEQLADMQNDMKNLLDNINVGVVFLDQNMMIRRYTREATRVYRLVASDIGRFLGDIKSDLSGRDLVAEARTVLDTLSPFEDDVRAPDGGCYLARIQPYRTLDNVIEGVVVTFTDISKLVVAKETLVAERTARILAEGIVDTIMEPMLVLDGALNVVSASRAFYRYFQVAADDTVGRRIFELGNGQWDIPALRELLENILPRDQSFDGYPVTQDFPLIGRRTLKLNARRLVNESGRAQLILLAMDIDANLAENPARE